MYSSPIFLIATFYALTCWSQNYDYSYVGDTSSYAGSPTFGICLMGGATENDAGAEWFLNRSDEGNVLVLRASGTDAYNDYFYNQLNSNVRSVETIIFQSAAASTDPFVLNRIEAAEAIWIAGGDQSVYEAYWKNTPVANLLDEHVNVKEAVIGGTSAGMAILGDHYFSASNGTITSGTALNNPMDPSVAIDSDFLKVPYLGDIITDTHYDNPDRKGRHAVFLAHLLVENDTMNYGIAAEEYVAICVDETGVARIFGEHPTYEDYAWFLRLNCDLIPPATMTEGAPLEWSPETRAIQACKMPGTPSGDQYFDLITWNNMQGGTWEDWNITSGSLTTQPANRIDCATLSVQHEKTASIAIEVNKKLQQIIFHHEAENPTVLISNSLGQVVHKSNQLKPVKTHNWAGGIYVIRLITKQQSFYATVDL